MVRIKGDYQLDIVTLWKWKGDTHSNIWRTSNNIGDGSVLQMDKLRTEVFIPVQQYVIQAITRGMSMSYKWASYVQKCLFTLTNAHNPNQIQVRLAIFR